MLCSTSPSVYSKESKWIYCGTNRQQSSAWRHVNRYNTTACLKSYNALNSCWTLFAIVKCISSYIKNFIYVVVLLVVFLSNKVLALRRSKQMAFLYCPPLFTHPEQQPDSWLLRAAKLIREHIHMSTVQIRIQQQKDTVSGDTKKKNSAKYINKGIHRFKKKKNGIFSPTD